MVHSYSHNSYCLVADGASLSQFYLAIAINICQYSHILLYFSYQVNCSVHEIMSEHLE